jgi:hypothetical protein
MYSDELTKEIWRLIRNENLNCSIEDFKDNVNWSYISKHKKYYKDV